MSVMAWLAVAAASLIARSWVPGLIAAGIAAALAVAITSRNLIELGMQPDVGRLAPRALIPFAIFALLRGVRWLALRLKGRQGEG